MKVCSLASGSKGNCTLIQNDNTKILIDVGVNVKYVLSCFEKLQVNPAEISAVLITHEHSDHIKGVGSFCLKYDIPIFCAKPLYDVLVNQMPLCNHLINIYDSNFEIGDIKVFPFELSHDSISCMGYKVVDESGSASFVTDTGYVSDKVFEIIKNSNLVFLESNYDADMLFACNYPTFLKKRIIGLHGHMSNNDSAKIILALIKNGTNYIALSHISDNSNTPYLAYNTVKKYVESNTTETNNNFYIGINYQMKLNTIYNIKNKNNNIK